MLPGHTCRSKILSGTLKEHESLRDRSVGWSVLIQPPRCMNLDDFAEATEYPVCTPV